MLACKGKGKEDRGRKTVFNKLQDYKFKLWS